MMRHGGIGILQSLSKAMLVAIRCSTVFLHPGLKRVQGTVEEATKS